MGVQHPSPRDYRARVGEGDTSVPWREEIALIGSLLGGGPIGVGPSAEGKEL